jgi:hypothetical protein
MRTSPTTAIPDSPTSGRVPLRLRLRDPVVHGQVDGVWWPQSRNLQAEARDLVDNLPAAAGRINRLLFSRPDWDDALVDGRGARRVQTGRGPVKMGSFPSDDTQLMILAMATGQRLRIAVVPSDTESAEAQARMDAVERAVPAGDADRAWAIWDDEAPST